jgi:hypothetical protein
MMKNLSMPWRYTLLTLRLDLLWLPGVLWVLFALVTWLKHADGQVFEVAVGFLGFALPLIAGILASSTVLDNPALELHFAAPRPAWRVLLERQGLILVLIAVAALTFQIYLLPLNVDVSRLGSPINRQLAWLVPTLALMSLGCAGAFALRQSMGGALLAGLVWVLQIIGHDLFMQYDVMRCLFVFLSAYQPQHPNLYANQIAVLSLTVMLFVLAWALFKKQERYL